MGSECSPTSAYNREKGRKFGGRLIVVSAGTPRLSQTRVSGRGEEDGYAGAGERRLNIGERWGRAKAKLHPSFLPAEIPETR